ncbi:HS12A-like protein [Mya arenaria]|uniref:HS12A-like protein n=1 Tax=Mya arenaria TaxID=6604 RepID=A0ABY7EXV0_MYAAR|nr:HS12A-like protein [Mya arenaria]WAR13262.1 HS12A-like protein [Mya arenaria]
MYVLFANPSSNPTDGKSTRPAACAMSVTSSTRSRASVTTIPDSSFTVVVALDVGTAYSGYAYAFRHTLPRKEMDENMDSVIMNSPWTGPDKLSTFKAPTHLLLNEKREFEAFGYEARKRHALSACFKWQALAACYKRQPLSVLKASHTLKDETGKSLQAIRVFAITLRFLKGHLLNTLRMRGKEVSTEDIKWMVTVPAVCNDLSKQFIRQACVQAGIPGERLKIALEGEVASVYCQHMRGVGKLPIHAAGCSYVVADIGGGKTDIILHHRRPDGRLKEMNKGGGCMVGANQVENAFLQFLLRVLGAPAMREFLDDCKVEVLEFLQSFEASKKLITSSQTKPVTVLVPVGLERICRKKHNGEDMSGILQKSMYKEKVKVVDNHFHFDPSLCKDFFRVACSEIARHIRNVLTDKNAKECTVLILVGGMASSSMVQDLIKLELESGTSIQRIFVPPEPELAALKGAVMFGHQPKSIFQRVIRYTYGLRKAKLFNPDIHPHDRLVSIHGVDFITDVFCPFISAGSRAPVGFMSYDSLTSIEPMQKVIEIDVYFSPELNPTFVNDKHCALLGKIEYQIPNPSKEERTIYVEFIFGDTELFINITDRKTASRFKNSFPEIEK